MRLWLSQNPSGSAGQRATVRSDRVWRLMKRVGIKAQVGYRSPRARKGEASIVSPNRLQRQFNPDAPNERWVTDITYSVPGVQGGHGCLNEPRVCLEY
jgi:putative transposase